jgi:NADP-dependent 3-hydroxy acid dehydrogenase YdfG
MMIEPRMNADDVGRAVAYMASLPPDTNVLFMTVMANDMPFVGRG